MALQWHDGGEIQFCERPASNRIKGTKIDLAKLLSGIDQAKKDSVTAKLTRLMVFGDVSAGTRTALEKALLAEPAGSQAASAQTPSANVSVAFDAKNAPMPATATPPAPYVAELVTLLIGSPEFQQR
jgi:hypothetical protein